MSPLSPEPQVVVTLPAATPTRLWLDDKRPAPTGWVHAHTAVEAIFVLAGLEVEDASLDHDLGHCETCSSCKGYKSTCGCKCHMTGYSVALWMASTGRWPKNRPTCHSANPAGKANIEATITRYFGSFIARPEGEFRMTWKEQAVAEEFRARHHNKCNQTVTVFHGYGHKGFSYRFRPTGIGTRVDIVCLECRKKKDITEYTKW